jgi:glycosyltransferase involved in cell wall biosynthesis
MTYAGSMYGRRKPDYFLRALNKAIEDQLVDEKDILLQFVGDFSKQNIEKISGMLGDKKIVQFYPYMEHKKSIEFLLNSDVLLLIVGKGIGDKNFYTGKIFEYINTQKTILGLVPEDGAAAMVIEETKTGYVVDSTEVDKIAACIGDIYSRWKHETLEVQPNYEAIRQYDRVNLTNQLSKILDQVSKG